MYTILVEWHVFELVLAKILDVFTDSIHCSADGRSWYYSSSKGNLFMMLHIIGISLTAGITRAVFIKTAKPHGIFGGLDEEDDISEEPIKAPDSKEKKESKKRR